MPCTSLVPIHRALISVADKTGLVTFAQFLHHVGVQLVSTGGSASILRDANLPVTEVSEYTGFPEILDGRVKTLHPFIHAGLLALRDCPDHTATMVKNGILPIDLLVVNLYNFEQKVLEEADFDACIEMIDIGGSALIRAAAKNYASVLVVVDPKDYEIVIETMIEYHNRAVTPLTLRRKLASVAYARTAAYDAVIANRFSKELGEIFPPYIVYEGTLHQILRYGENPHQKAALYVRRHAKSSLSTSIQTQGKELSYNNICDIDTAVDLVSSFKDPAVTIVKHTNPCGCAIALNLRDAYLRALSCDQVSAFGGVVAVNKTLEVDTAIEIAKIFTEVVVAPDATHEARLLLSQKKNLRLILTKTIQSQCTTNMQIRSITGGFLVQTCDTEHIDQENLKVVTHRVPTKQELGDLLFGWTVCKYVKSNAIVFSKDLTTVGIGSGQMSRVESVRIASWKMEQMKVLLKEVALASDAFFPFPDGLVVAHAAGVTAIIQPGGSNQDEAVIQTANAYDMAMVFTGIRHFRH